MAIRLSHTAKELYLRCPLAYYMYYVLGYRTKKVGSALLFGSAIDEATEEYFKGKNLEAGIKKFNDLWTSPKINKVVVDGPTSDLIEYSSGDTKEGLAETAWESMKIKGEMLLSHFYEEIVPRVKNVYSTQQIVNITNDIGDRIFGLADVVLEWEDGKNYVIDVKTSSKSYSKDAVTNLEGQQGDKSRQLALYYETLKDKFELSGAGFFVVEKGIRKKEGARTRLQVLIDEIPEGNVEKTFEEFDSVLYNVRMGLFPSNHPSCNKFYGKCICDKYYRSNGTNLDGLVLVKKESK